MIEIRVPTYKRPKLLHRALTSLLAQSGVEWRAIVLDDSAHEDNRGVVSDLADPRLQYCPNPQRLGLCGNLANAFSPKPFFINSRFACILEDDNVLVGGALASARLALENSGADILVRPVGIAKQDAFEFRRTDASYPPHALGLASGRPAPIDRYRLALCGYGFPNAGIVWRLNGAVDLSCRSDWRNEHVQERLRSLLDRCHYRYEDSLHAWATSFSDSIPAPHNSSLTNRWNRICREIEALRLFRELFHKYVMAGGDLESLENWSVILNTKSEVERSLGLVSRRMFPLNWQHGFSRKITGNIQEAARQLLWRLAISVARRR